MAAAVKQNSEDKLSNSDSNTLNTTDWMGHLPQKLHSVPLNSIAIPGSHDSFASFLDKSGPLSPDCELAIKDLVKIFGSVAKDIIYKWSITQDLNFTQQLNEGIRYFDLRVTTKPGTEDLYFAHCLYGWKIEDCMNEINNYLEAHPKEVVFLDFNHFYNLTEFQHKQFLSLLLEIFGYKMCPFLDTESVTLDMLWEQNLQVIIFYHDDIVKEYLQFWPGDSIPSPWANTTEVGKLIPFLDKNIKQGRPLDKFYVSQGVCTPTTAYIVGHITGSLKDSMSKQVVIPFITWIKQQHIGGEHGVNMFIMDFCQMGQYPQAVIQLNYQGD